MFRKPALFGERWEERQFDKVCLWVACAGVMITTFVGLGVPKTDEWSRAAWGFASGIFAAFASFFVARQNSQLNRIIDTYMQSGFGLLQSTANDASSRQLVESLAKRRPDTFRAKLREGLSPEYGATRITVFRNAQMLATHCSDPSVRDLILDTLPISDSALWTKCIETTGTLGSAGLLKIAFDQTPRSETARTNAVLWLLCTLDSREDQRQEALRYLLKSGNYTPVQTLLGTTGRHVCNTRTIVRYLLEAEASKDRMKDYVCEALTAHARMLHSGNGSNTDVTYTANAFNCLMEVLADLGIPLDQVLAVASFVDREALRYANDTYRIAVQTIPYGTEAL